VQSKPVVFDSYRNCQYLTSADVKLKLEEVNGSYCAYMTLGGSVYRREGSVFTLLTNHTINWKEQSDMQCKDTYLFQTVENLSQISGNPDSPRNKTQPARPFRNRAMRRAEARERKKNAAENPVAANPGNPE
jgi:hypothetical protein